MNTIDLLNLLKRLAVEYKKESQKSVARNNHMNEISTGEVIEQRHIDAVLVDFINYIGVKNCVDYALYTEDI